MLTREQRDSIIKEYNKTGVNHTMCELAKDCNALEDKLNLVKERMKDLITDASSIERHLC